MQKARDWIIVSVIFAAAIVIAVWIELRPMRGGENAVVPVKARRLIDLPASLAKSGPGPSAYQWLDDHTILVHDTDSDYALDVHTGRKSVPTGIQKVVDRYKGKRLSSGISGWSLSPDKKWAVGTVYVVPPSDSEPSTPPPAMSAKEMASTLAKGEAFLSHQGRRMLIKLDGSVAEDVGPAIGELGEVFWHPDGKGWFEVDSDGEDSGTVLDWTLAGSKATRRMADKRTTAVSSMSVVGAVANDSLLTLAGGSDDDNSAAEEDDSDMESVPYNVVRFGKGQEETVDTRTYHFGTMAVPMGHELCPDGKRIVWNYMAMPGVAGTLVETALTHQAPYREEIKVCNLDGSGMRLIIQGAKGDPTAGPGCVHWTPDGKSVSYIFRGALWVAPVD